MLTMQSIAVYKVLIINQAMCVVFFFKIALLFNTCNDGARRQGKISSDSPTDGVYK